MMADILALLPIAFLVLIVGGLLCLFEKVQDRRFEQRIAEQVTWEAQSAEHVWPPPPKRVD